jgi:hypothetical protein
MCAVSQVVWLIGSATPPFAALTFGETALVGVIGALVGTLISVWNTRRVEQLRRRTEERDRERATMFALAECFTTALPELARARQNGRWWSPRAPLPTPGLSGDTLEALFHLRNLGSRRDDLERRWRRTSGIYGVQRPYPYADFLVADITRALACLDRANRLAAERDGGLLTDADRLVAEKWMKMISGPFHHFVSQDAWMDFAIAHAHVESADVHDDAIQQMIADAHSAANEDHRRAFAELHGRGS